MLTLTGKSSRHLRGFSRREVLTIGSLGCVGLNLPDLLRAENAAGIHHSRKSIINVHLDGGPPQMDTIDPKPFAPVEIRGDIAPIATSVPGIHLSELMPQVASIADRFTFIRSLVGSEGQHHAFQCQSGYRVRDLAGLGGRPAMGCVVAKLRGRADEDCPLFVDMMQGRPLVRNSARPGFLGPAYQPFRPDLSEVFPRELEPAMKGELLRLGGGHQLSLVLNERLSPSRLDGRQQLLDSLDSVRRTIDDSGMMEAMDQFQRQAAGILTSGRLAEALDLSCEDPRIRARYIGPPLDGPLALYTAEGPESTQKLLLARRLIEAGVRVVSVSISDFDTHTNNFGRMRQLVPIVDWGLHALVTDLEERGMIDDVTIVVWGEFGRTPKINANAGRDHWPQVGPCLLAGGGLRTGIVVGETDRIAGSVISRPVTYKDVFSTLYRTLGLDARQLTITDPQGRPQYVLDEGETLREVI